MQSKSASETKGKRQRAGHRHELVNENEIEYGNEVANYIEDEIITGCAIDAHLSKAN